jgi:lipoyl(octanoyl) transferase
MMDISFRWLGLLPYSEALDLQFKLHEEVKTQSGGFVLGLEHPAVITLGRRATVEDDLLAQESTLNEMKVQLFKVDRGGQATLHSPGQLVIYPILNLDKYKIGVKSFVEILHRVSQKTLEDYGIHSEIRYDSGLYTLRGKIVFTGLRIEQGVSRHGLAININNNLEQFSLIRPCGRAEETFDSIAYHHKDASSQEVFKLWQGHFSSEFS